MRRRKSNNCSSRIWLISSPSTIMRPESGRINPSDSFRIRLFPEPATPKITFVSPARRWKEIPRNTSLSPKANSIFSNTTAGAEFSCVFKAADSRGKAGADMESMVRKRSHEKSRDDQIHHQNQHRSSHHGLGGSAAHSLGSSAGIHPIEAADGGDDEAKDDRLDQSHECILED